MLSFAFKDKHSIAGRVEQRLRDGLSSATSNFGGPRQCKRVDVLPDVRHFVISNRNGEDPICFTNPGCCLGRLLRDEFSRQEEISRSRKRRYSHAPPSKAFPRRESQKLPLLNPQRRTLELARNRFCFELF